MPATKLPYEIVIFAVDEGSIALDDFANFLRDLVTFHDRLCVITSPKYREYNLSSSFFYTRYGRPIPAGQSLRLTHLKKESPLEIGLLLASAAIFGRAVQPFVQGLRDLVLLPGDYRKQRGDIRRQELDEQLIVQRIENVRLDNMERRKHIAQDAVLKNLRGDRLVRERLDHKTEALLRRDIERIGEHPIQITGVETKRTIPSEETEDADESES